MSARLLAGAAVAFAYNRLVGKCPSRTLRALYLGRWLKSLGKGTGVQMDCCFLNGRKVELGDRNVINSGCLFDGRVYEIRTGTDVSIGPEASILTLGHDPQSARFADRGGNVMIGNYVWIGYRAIILPGVTIGDGAVVGAGAVVTRNVEPLQIVAGNPARPVGSRSEMPNYHLAHDPFLG